MVQFLIDHCALDICLHVRCTLLSISAYINFFSRNVSTFKKTCLSRSLQAIGFEMRDTARGCTEWEIFVKCSLEEQEITVSLKKRRVYVARESARECEWSNSQETPTLLGGERNSDNKRLPTLQKWKTRKNNCNASDPDGKWPARGKIFLNIWKAFSGLNNTKKIKIMGRKNQNQNLKKLKTKDQNKKNKYKH